MTATVSSRGQNGENYNNSEYHETTRVSPSNQLKTIAVQSSPQSIVSSLVKNASQLRGLTFGNNIDELLQGGLSPKTLTFVYGNYTEELMNVLCGNAVQIFGGQAVFIDAANSFDPYTIVKECAHPKNSKASEELLRSIIISRAFTCYQLTDLVVKQLGDLVAARNNPKSSTTEKQIKFIVVSGISSVFNEQDNTKTETERLQCLMASSLSKIATDRRNGVLFVAASSKERCGHFVSKSDVAIKLFDDKKTGRQKAVLEKHYARRFAEVEF